ncbi:hypothetical protein [Rhodanobacter sp. DHG33]|uniref:hypothetical protein n=1 Tax=Rhodanobacter sp. DHG33 TaxID=2775921 RepID=UPI00178242C7|nr:hypothetical protein [Rhodanobacter sp. DHG33]MBD8900475.1 hypothetical protein [Rhodanobacter sp. DHG33]
MRRLSSVIKPRYDRAITLALMAMAVLAVMAAWPGRGHGGSVPWTTMLVCVLPIIPVLSVRGRRLLASEVVDEAWIDGDELLLKRADQPIRMPLASIASVEAERVGGLVTLELGLPCALGNCVRFFAAPRAGRDIGIELRQRIAQVRRHT